MSYRESWGFLQSYRPWSVQMWPDGTRELADISCGDPWYEEPDGRDPGGGRDALLRDPQMGTRGSGSLPQRLTGLDLYDCWRGLSWTARFRSIFGTMRRVIQRKLYRRLRLDRAEGRAVGKPVGR